MAHKRFPEKRVVYMQEAGKNKEVFIGAKKRKGGER